MRLGKLRLAAEIILLIIALLLFSTSCTTLNRIPPKNNNPIPQEQVQEQEPKKNNEAEAQKPTKPLSDEKEGEGQQSDIEENINGLDLDEDRALTNNANEKKFTQKDVGVPEDERNSKLAETDENIEVLQVYKTQLPQGIIKDLQYNQYPISYDYFLITDANVEMREKPDSNAKVVCKGIEGEKLSLLEKVKGQIPEGKKSDIWYKVMCRDGGKIQSGYLHAETGQPRHFRFDKMLDSLNALKKIVDGNKVAYISNYKNYNGAPPMKDNNSFDQFGYRAYQSAAGYTNPDKASEYRYIPDGTLITVLQEQNGLIQVYVPAFGGKYWVEKKYVSYDGVVQELNKVVVVDRKYQNQASFENRNGTWVMVSHTYATTGMKGDFSFETPLGYFNLIQKRDKFLYYADGTTDIAGYAPFALRFSGGAYIHGVPVEYIIKDGQQIDPGTTEYLHTIGTFPRSHMCVRNYTSHARFLHDWLEIGKSAIIVIE